MKKSLLVLPIFLIGVTFASEWFPAFPMTIYWNANLTWWTLKVYDWSNQEIGNYEITSEWKYWSDNAFILPLSLNSFNWNLDFKAVYNWKNYTIDSIDDSNKWEWCPNKNAITFVSENCRYNLIFKEESNNNWWNSWWWGWWGWWWWGWWGWWWWGWWGWADWNILLPNNDTWIINIGVENTWWTNEWESNNTNTAWNQSRFNNWNPQDILSNGFTIEFNNAYMFSFLYWITTMQDIHHANMNWGLNRIAMAKMLSQYAINILKKIPDTTKNCNFWDVTMQMDSDYNNWVTLACQLWLMWVWIDKFRPNDEVVRAEFWTALSRMLYWLDDWKDNYYSTHLAKLKREWIISNDNPTLWELRWYVMLMLMRSAQ